MLKQFIREHKQKVKHSLIVYTQESEYNLEAIIVITDVVKYTFSEECCKTTPFILYLRF